MYSLCGSTTAIAPIGLSQCSRPLSPVLPLGAGGALHDAAALALFRLCNAACAPATVARTPYEHENCCAL